MSIALHHQSGGVGDTTYLMLHGLGATGDVWNGLRDIISREKAGRWVIPDMRGHGGSEWADSYHTNDHATDAAALVQNDKKIIVIGHSMGGLIAIDMASQKFGASITAALCIGNKCDWPDEEQVKLHAFAQKPPRWFENRDEAADRFLKVSGLGGIIEPSETEFDRALVQGEQGFRLAADPKTVTVGGPPEGPYSQIACKVMLACGELDQISSITRLRELDPTAIEIPNAGHNTHVENPQAIWELVKKLEAEL